MLQYLLSSRLIQCGLVFFVLSVSGSFLYSWHVKRTTEKEFARHDRFLRGHSIQSEMPTTPDTINTSRVDFEQTETSLEAEDSQAIVDDTETCPSDDAASIDLADVFLPDSIDLEAELTEDVRVSAFGFGPYPEVPIDYPEPDIWDRIDNMADRGLAREVELMARVCIKLWNQGVKAIGASLSYSDGKVYPTIPGIAYVKWKWEELPDGKHRRYASRISGSPELVGKEHYIYELGIAPPGITIIDYEEGGIDPYEFLSLQR